MQKPKRKIKDSFLLIDIINKKSLKALNSLFKTRYTKKQVRGNIRVQRARKKFRFWKKLMETSPRFDRKGGELRRNKEMILGNL